PRPGRPDHRVGRLAGHLHLPGAAGPAGPGGRLVVNPRRSALDRTAAGAGEGVRLSRHRPLRCRAYRVNPRPDGRWPAVIVAVVVLARHRGGGLRPETE